MNTVFYSKRRYSDTAAVEIATAEQLTTSTVASQSPVDQLAPQAYQVNRHW